VFHFFPPVFIGFLATDSPKKISTFLLSDIKRANNDVNSDDFLPTSSFQIEFNILLPLKIAIPVLSRKPEGIFHKFSGKILGKLSWSSLILNRNLSSF